MSRGFNGLLRLIGEEQITLPLQGFEPIAGTRRHAWEAIGSNAEEVTRRVSKHHADGCIRGKATITQKSASDLACGEIGDQLGACQEVIQLYPFPPGVEYHLITGFQVDRHDGEAHPAAIQALDID